MATNIVGGERRFPDIVVANYTDLSTNFPAALYTNQYAEVINSQGTSWLPGSIGGTYYSKGFYKSNGTVWEYIGSFPYQATQAQVNAGTNNDRFVTPLTLRNSSQWDDKLDVSAIPSNLILYATSATSDVVGYLRLVTDISDPDYDSPAIDIPTGPITGTGQLIASLIADAGLINGNPGIINLVTTGNIRRTTNNGSGDFYYEVYHRDSGGTETLIATSSNTVNVTNMVYEQFYAPALLNNGSFAPTDRLVIKYYGNKTSSATPEYEFQFGGTQPVRTLLPIPITATFSGGGGSVQWIEKGSNYNVNNYEGILADTLSGSFTVTLPATPTLGDTVGITDAKGNFGVNSLFVARNGSLIQGLANDLEIDVKDASFLLIYTGATTGWKLDTYLDKVIDPTNYVPTSRTINGLDLTANRTLTTANINDSADRRYVTDRGRDIANNTWRHINSADSAPIPVSASNVVVRSVLIPAGTLTTNSVLKYQVKYDKENTDGPFNTFVDINTADTLVGSTNISRNTNINNTIQFVNHERDFACDGANLKEVLFSANLQTPISQPSRATYTPINTTVDNWLLFNVRVSGATDILRMIYLEIEICSQ